MMPPCHSEPRVQCLCARCALNPNGFTYQTRQVVAKHHKKWPPGSTIHQRIGRDQQQDRFEGPAPQQGRPEHLPSPPAQKPDSDDGFTHWDPPDDDQFEDAAAAGQFDNPVRLEQENQRQEDQPPQRQGHAPVRPLLDRNFRLVELPPAPEPGSDRDQEDQPSLVPKAFQERPEIRLAYMNSVISNVFGKASVQEATASLNSTLDSLLVAGVLPEHPRPVRHLISAKRRLGIDPDQWITQYTICPVCWKHFTPTELQDLASPDCPIEDCDGLLYKESTDGRGRRVREPFRIMPHTSLIGSLRRMFMRPGFARSLRDSRGDQPRRNDNHNYIMTDMHDGSDWHDQETNIVREIGELGSIRDRAVENGENVPTKLTDHRYGLHLTMNIDWMGILENRPHSSGPIYFAINDLPRDQRFLQINIICAAVMPGPKEPDVRQINHCLEPCVRELIKLKRGVNMDIHGEQEHAEVYADLTILDCDMPAAHKCSGMAGHGHDFHPCPFCDVNILGVNKRDGYDNSWQEKDDNHLLRQAFYSRSANPARQETILKDHGIRWSILNTLAGWFPTKKTALDFMHCVFLGIICHLFMKILFGGYMFPGAGGTRSAKKRFENLINSVQWPSHITRLPKNMGENQSLKKADEWRRILTITPVLLWWAWKDGDDEIPDSEPPLPPNTQRPDSSRNRRSLYEAVLLLCAGVRILSSRQISMAQAETGQTFLSQYCQRCLQLKVHLTINHHASMHIATMIKRFGPVYSWWLFAFERFNGMLERVKLNGHDGGRMELTLMRNWIQTHLIYEHLISLPDNAHPLERQALERVIKTQATERSALMTQIAVYQSEAAQDGIRLPLRQAKFINLRTYGPSGIFYTLLFNYCHQLWPDLNIINDLTLGNGTPFFSDKVARALSYVRKDGIRYGCEMNRRTQADSFAFILDDSVRAPVHIVALFIVGLSDKVPQVCAIIRRMVSDDVLPALPWHLYSSTLGIHVTYANSFHEHEVVPITKIDSPLALIPAYSDRIDREIWISVSCDHVGNEPDDIFDEDD